MFASIRHMGETLVREIKFFVKNTNNPIRLIPPFLTKTHVEQIHQVVLKQLRPEEKDPRTNYFEGSCHGWKSIRSEKEIKIAPRCCETTNEDEKWTKATTYLHTWWTTQTMSPFLRQSYYFAFFSVSPPSPIFRRHGRFRVGSKFFILLRMGQNGGLTFAGSRL